MAGQQKNNAEGQCPRRKERQAQGVGPSSEPTPHNGWTAETHVSMSRAHSAQPQCVSSSSVHPPSAPAQNNLCTAEKQCTVPVHKAQKATGPGLRVTAPRAQRAQGVGSSSGSTPHSEPTPHSVAPQNGWAAKNNAQCYGTMPQGQRAQGVSSSSEPTPYNGWTAETHATWHSAQRAQPATKRLRIGKHMAQCHGPSTKYPQAAMPMA